MKRWKNPNIHQAYETETLMIGRLQVTKNNSNKEGYVDKQTYEKVKTYREKTVVKGSVKWVFLQIF